MTSHVMLFDWDGDAMVPRPPFRKKCDEEFAVGGIYRLEVREERSWQSHAHYFASLHDAWVNLPEHLAERIPTAEHLRKFALIKAGYRDERAIAADSPAEAERLKALVKSYDDFAIISSDGNIVTVLTAKSQSMRAMGKKDFSESKQKVLDIVAGLIGTDTDTLKKNAGRAA